MIRAVSAARSIRLAYEHVDRAELLGARQPVAQRLGLAAAVVGQAGAAVVPADELLGVRVGLAVADQEQASVSQG